MIEEYQSIMKNDVWDIVLRPKRKFVMTLKWIYKIKHAADGSIGKYKEYLWHEDSDRILSCYRCKSLLIIHPFLLGEATSHKSRFIFLYVVICNMLSLLVMRVLPFLFLVCVVRAWSSFPIFSSRAMIRASSCEHSSHSLLKVINFILPQIPWMKASYDLGRPLRVVITISPFSTSSSIASSCSLIWETLVKYDYMVSAF